MPREKTSRNQKASDPHPVLTLPPPAEEHLDISALETWLWDAACAIRGATDAPKFKDLILPLVFYKRLSDVFDDEFSERAAEFGDEATAREIIEADHSDAPKSERKPIVRSFILDTYCWKAIGNHLAERYRRRFVTDAVREVPVRIPTFNACSTSRTTGSTRAANATLDCNRCRNHRKPDRRCCRPTLGMIAQLGRN